MGFSISVFDSHSEHNRGQRSACQARDFTPKQHSSPGSKERSPERDVRMACPGRDAKLPRPMFPLAAASRRITCCGLPGSAYQGADDAHLATARRLTSHSTTTPASSMDNLAITLTPLGPWADYFSFWNDSVSFLLFLLRFFFPGHSNPTATVVPLIRVLFSFYRWP